MDTSVEAGSYLEIFRLFMVGCFQIAIPMLLIILIVALIVGVLQSVTQIQEQSLTFFPKVMTLILILIVAGSWMYKKAISVYTEYFQEIMRLF